MKTKLRNFWCLLTLLPTFILLLAPRTAQSQFTQPYTTLILSPSPSSGQSQLVRLDHATGVSTVVNTYPVYWSNFNYLNRPAGSSLTGKIVLPIQTISGMYATTIDSTTGNLLGVPAYLGSVASQPFHTSIDFADKYLDSILVTLKPATSSNGTQSILTAYDANTGAVLGVHGTPIPYSSIFQGSLTYNGLNQSIFYKDLAVGLMWYQISTGTITTIYPSPASPFPINLHADLVSGNVLGINYESGSFKVQAFNPAHPGAPASTLYVVPSTNFVNVSVGSSLKGDEYKFLENLSGGINSRLVVVNIRTGLTTYTTIPFPWQNIQFID